MTATMALPGRVAPIPLTLAPTKDKTRYVSAVEIPFSGTWILTMRAFRTDVEEFAATANLRIG